ncbi:histidine ammonia-lyase [Bacillus sp. M6-12]|uniref:histidine ammonia-lyase n=1 Tax=Bacillus sp. M6-12 TaxID=2054166 RepID=UPI000C77F8A3|nr:histidine ammonia-lyase [Bacillus sp. M6-12]PLS14786.1 histidine ammonia-lyase [Bacillus sp. M6-12]
MMKTIHQSILIEGQQIKIEDVVAVAREGLHIQLSETIKNKITRCRMLVEKFVQEERVIYGITTGLGDLCKVSIPSDKLCVLSKNIIMSHACGMGAPLPYDQIRAIMFSAILNFSHGHSGVRLKTVETLLNMLNYGVIPHVPGQGSVGYLTHMAHISLVMIGLGEAYFEGQLYSGKEAMEKAGIETIVLEAKEGLSLVNGTVCMTGISALAIYDSIQLAKWTDIAGAMSFEALKGTRYAFDKRINELRPYKGQIQAADNLLRLISGSEISENFKDYRVQDALSLRAMPQVHGASRDKINHALEMVLVELNAATDNPLIFETENGGVSISSCNAHGEPLAQTMDLLAIAVSELGNISERRIDRLVNPHVSELPAFLVSTPGLNTGFMIPQYVAASLVAENKVLSHPISVDSIPMSGYQEDHVSMGTPAAIKAYQVIRNVQKVIAIELLTAAQALEFHHPYQFGAGTSLVYQMIRAEIPAWTEDRVFYPDLEKINRIVEQNLWIGAVEARIGAI